MKLDPGNPVLKEAIQNMVGDVTLVRGSLNNFKFSSTATAAGTYWKFNSNGTYLLDPNGIVLNPEMVLSTDYPNSTRIASASVAGTGAVSFSSSGGKANTGNTATSSVAMDWTLSVNGNFKAYAGNPKFSAACAMEATMTTNGDVMFFGIGQPTTNGTDITMTDKHIGFKVKRVAGAINLYATQADGVTEDVSGILTTVANSDQLDLIFNHTSDTKTDFYWRKNGGSLSAATTLNTKPPASSTTETIVRLAVSNAGNAESVTFSSGGATYRR